MAPRVALATCGAFPDLDDDDRPLLAALADLGVEAVPATWDDPGQAWDHDLVVVRSTWDYQHRRDAFLAWVDGLPAVANPADVLRWDTDKRYLLDLAAAGIPTVPTTFVAPGDPLPPIDGEVVVKPAVSAGSRDTSRHAAGDEERAAQAVRALTDADRVVMVQPYVAAVDSAGETGLLFLDGRWSHAIRKGPILRAGAPPVEGVLFAEEAIEARTPTAAERELAEAVLDAVPGGRERLLYARVDLVPGPDGPLLLELELAEPSLFLATAPGSLERFAAAIVGRVA